MGDNTTRQNNSNTTTGQSATQATPYSQAQPLLDTGLAATKQFNDQTMKLGQYANYFNAGSNALADNAKRQLNTPALDGLFSGFGDTFGNGGYNTEQRSALDALNPIAAGDYLDISQAPGYQQVRDRIQADAATEAAMSASMRGRGGSPYAQGHVASEVADTLAGYDLGQYNTERDRQAGAIGQLFNMGQTGMSNTAAAPGIYEALLQARNAPATSLMALGSVPNAQAGGLLDAATYANPFARTRQETRGQGTSTGTTTQPSNLLGQIGGGLLGGASLLFG